MLLPRNASAVFILLLSTVLLNHKITYADVTVTMEGSVYSTPAPLGPYEDFVKWYFDRTNFYKNDKFRTENGYFAYIVDLKNKKIIFLNKRDQTYTIITKNLKKISSLEQKAIGGGTYTVKVDRRKLTLQKYVKCLGHKCRHYKYTERLVIPDLNEALMCRADEYVAVDIPTSNKNNHNYFGGVPVMVMSSLGLSAGVLVIKQEATGINYDDIPDYVFQVPDGYINTQTHKTFHNAQYLKAVNQSVNWSSDVKPDTGLSKAAVLKKAELLISRKEFDKAGDLVKSVAKRGNLQDFGPVFNALGDEAFSKGFDDKAWGWYCLTMQYVKDPKCVSHAYLGIAQYYITVKSTYDARKNLNLLIDLPNAPEEDKAKARELLKSL